MKTTPSTLNPDSTDYRATLIAASALGDTEGLAQHLRSNRLPSPDPAGLLDSAGARRVAELKRLALRHTPQM